MPIGPETTGEREKPARGSECLAVQAGVTAGMPRGRRDRGSGRWAALPAGLEPSGEGNPFAALAALKKRT